VTVLLVDRSAQMGVTLVPEGCHPFARLIARENLGLGGLD
jgi:ABC-type branched-subunit amino acid transport system ATPase component